MYELKKEKTPEKEMFAFDLEKQIKAHPNRKKEILDQAEKKILEIKKNLREGVKESDYDSFNILLNGYTALQKVLKKIAK